MTVGNQMYLWAKDLFPICRSITGPGTRKTLRYIKKIIPKLNIRSIKSGTKVFDWTIPKEWIIRDASIKDIKGNRIIDFKKNNLHVVGYSEPVNKILSKQKTDNLTNTFFKVISSNKRFAKLSSIISQFININSQKRGDVLADVTSADELSDNQKNKIYDQLKSILGEKLSLNFNVDNKILGGLIVKIGSKMIDSSLASKINKLKVAIEGAQWK